MKKTIATLTLLLLGVLLLSCGAGNGGGTTTAPVTTPPVTTPPTTTPTTTPPTTTLPPNQPVLDGSSVHVFGDANPFTVVYGAGDSVGRSAASALCSKVVSLGMTVNLPSADGDRAETACELLVGETSRALSTAAKEALAVRMATMPDSMHWIWLYENGQLALYASSADAYAAAIAELSTKYLSGTRIVFATDTRAIGLVRVPVPVLASGKVILYGGGEDFSVVYGKDSALGGSVASSLAAAVGALGLVAPETHADSEKTAVKCELLVGETDRVLSKKAMEKLAERLSERPHDEHWLWLYEDGRLALVASTESAYAAAIDELKGSFFSENRIGVSVDICKLGLIEHTRDAYMEYTVPGNFFEGYTDPFGMKADGYRTMTVTRVSSTLYRISHTDDLGGVFTADLVKRKWGLWAMGAMSYTEPDGTAHNMTSSSTDYEFVFKIGAKTPLSFRSGNHGDYPGDSNWQYYVDDTSKSNDRLLDMTMYDGKSGERIDLTETGASVTVNGLRIVMHHNIYEKNYTQENVLLNAERSYLYNGTDIHVDTKFYVTQKVNLGRSYSCMLPVWKTYGNCASFETVDGSSYLMKTVIDYDKGVINQDDVSLGINATKIDVWGERNPECHLKITLHNPEDMLMSSVSGKNGYTGIRDMQGGSSNKIYCSLFSQQGTLGRGDELHFYSTYSFSYEPSFVNPTGEPDRWVGVIGK